MFELKRNHMILISSSISVFGLIMIYFSALNIEPEKVEIGEVDQTLIGRSATVSGLIKNKNLHQNGHLFLTITDGKKDLQVPVFSSLMNALSEEGIGEKDFKLKQKIYITGLVDEYRNQLQIIPRKVSDIRFSEPGDLFS